MLITIDLEVWTTTEDRLGEVSRFRRQDEGRVIRDAYTKYLEEELHVNRDALMTLNLLEYAEWSDEPLGEAPRGVSKSLSELVVARISFQMELSHYRQFQVLAMARRTQSSPEKLLFEAINRHLDDCMAAKSRDRRAATKVVKSP